MVSFQLGSDLWAAGLHTSSEFYWHCKFSSWFVYSVVNLHHLHHELVSIAANGVFRVGDSVPMRRALLPVYLKLTSAFAGQENILIYTYSVAQYPADSRMLPKAIPSRKSIIEQDQSISSAVSIVVVVVQNCFWHFLFPLINFCYIFRRKQEHYFIFLYFVAEQQGARW